jgi:hypothetical protein
MKKMTNEEFIEKAKKVHGDKYDYSLIEYKNNEAKVKIICKKHGVFEQAPNSHLRHNCSKCIIDKLLSTNEEFIKKAKKIHGDKYDYSLVDYKGSHKKIKIICYTHGIFEQVPYSHLIGKGCNKCFAKNKCDSSEEFIKKAKKVYGNKYDYSLVKYENVTRKMKIICKKHGIFEQSASYHLRGVECPICRESKGEKKISAFLINKNINFEREKRFSDCRNILPLPFDFFLPELNTCIEFDGKQHFINNSAWYNTLLDIKKRDEIKNIYCKENNIILHRISYKDLNIVDQKLNEIFK